MISPGLRKTRQLLHVLFTSWGRYVGQHQILILLTVCVSLCLVIYPTAIAYTAALPYDPASASGPLFWLQRSLGFGDDVSMPWQEPDGRKPAFESSDSEVCWNRMPKAQVLRLVQVWVTPDPATVSEHGALDRAVLHTAADFDANVKSALQQIDPSTGWECLASPTTAQCISISPLHNWQHSKAAILSDADLLYTLSHSSTVSSNGFYVGPEHTTSGRHKAEPGTGWRYDRADSLVFTYFLRAVPGNVTDLDVVPFIEVAGKTFGGVAAKRQAEPRRILLKVGLSF